MGTCNYITQSNFDLYIYNEDLDDYTDIVVPIDLATYISNGDRTLIDFDKETYEPMFNKAEEYQKLGDIEILYDTESYDTMTNDFGFQNHVITIRIHKRDETYYEPEFIYREAKRLAAKLNNELIFHEINIRFGYYDGLQTFVKTGDWNYYNNVEDMDNDACKYYFGMCRSIAIRKYKAEVNRINKKLLPLFEKELGFDHIRCIGVFSNGEAIYERVK